MPTLTIKTAKTALRGNTHLATRTYENDAGEKLVTLLMVDARERECDHLTEEWQGILEHALLHTEESAYERLEGVLKELNGFLKGTMLSGHVGEVNGLIALLDSMSTLHVSQIGRAEGYLTRGGSTIQVTERIAGTHEIQFLHISSGALQGGDTITLSTERLLRSLTPAQLTQAVRQRGETLDLIRDTLEREKETAALALLALEENSEKKGEGQSTQMRERMRRRSEGKGRLKIASALEKIRSKVPLSRNTSITQWGKGVEHVRSFGGEFGKKISQYFRQFLSDLQHPDRKRRSHLLLLAGAIVIFVGIWSGFRMSIGSRISQTQADLEMLVGKINGDLQSAENRQIMGDLETANAILQRAEQEARSVLQHESGLFRTDALELLDRIRSKHETINNIIRLSPTIAANLGVKNSDITARGLIGLERGRMIVYDRQNTYSIIVNAVDEPLRIDGENLILDGAPFERYGTVIFMTKENRLIELIEGQPTAMKTDDPAGWLSGPDMETYLRFLYLLSPQNNQIYKYERLSNRYSSPSEWNVNGNLEGAIDMTIDSDVYILHQGGKITKLFRGEEKPFTIRNLPEGSLATATKIFKSTENGSIYLLDPEGSRVIVLSSDSASNESSYLKQYVLEGEKVGTLQDLYVDPEETHLFVLDEKKVFAINLQEG